MQNFFNLLKTEIDKGLPGTEVQLQMISSDNFLKNLPRSPGKDARNAAVLILLYPYNRSVYTVFMQRPDYEGIHGGQISFPGGKAEPSDTNIIQTAIREANEETGVDPAQISVIGTLTPLFMPVSNTLVTPVIGWTEKRPVFNHHPEEVLFLFDADIRRLLDPSIVKIKPIKTGSEMYEAKHFDYEGYVIWGATAMMLNELLNILRRSHFHFPE